MVEDDCKCRISKKVHYPQEERLYGLSDKYSREVGAWYELSSSSKDGDTFTCSTDVETIVDHNKDFEKMKNGRLRGVFFTTKEECQKFCDYINGTETEGYDYDLAGNLFKAREV